MISTLYKATSTKNTHPYLSRIFRFPVPKSGKRVSISSYNSLKFSIMEEAKEIDEEQYKEKNKMRMSYTYERYSGEGG